MILKYKIHYKFYCVVYSIIIYLLYTDTRLGRLWSCIRNRGGADPPTFQKCPFFGSKVPFTSVKNIVQIAFYDCICFCILVCPEKLCSFR